MRPASPAITCMILVAGALTAGCSGGGLAPVAGVVTLDGKPVEGATVALTPAGSGTPGRGVSDAAGRFQISSGSGKKGMRPGEYGVSVLKMTSKAVSAEQARSIEPGPDRRIDNQPTDGNGVTVIDYLVPQRYSSPATSGLSASVPASGATLTFDLRREPAAK